MIQPFWYQKVGRATATHVCEWQELCSVCRVAVASTAAHIQRAVAELRAEKAELESKW